MIGRMGPPVAWVAMVLSAVLMLGGAGPPRSQPEAVDWEAIGPAQPTVALFAPTSGALFAHQTSGVAGAAETPTDVLIRSDDAGVTWVLIPLPPPPPPGIARIAGNAAAQWESLVIDP